MQPYWISKPQAYYLILLYHCHIEEVISKRIYMCAAALCTVTCLWMDWLLSLGYMQTCWNFPEDCKGLCVGFRGKYTEIFSTQAHIHFPVVFQLAEGMNVQVFLLTFSGSQLSMFSCKWSHVPAYVLISYCQLTCCMHGFFENSFLVALEALMFLQSH